jgi:hypothetical protein
MAKNSSLPYHVAPLQRVVAEEITDPAEQQALDELRRRLRQDAQPTPASGSIPILPSVLVSRVVALCRQLPAAERGPLLARLGAELSAEQQDALLAQVVAQLPAAALQPLEGELSTRLGKCAS